MISSTAAIKIMIGLMVLVIAFHLAVIFQIIPYTIVWAGKINSVEEMRKFEIVSILINLVLLFTLLFKGKYLRSPFPEKVINVVLWIFTGIFFLNTIGNLFSATDFERYVFTPLTLIAGILCLRILRR